MKGRLFIIGNIGAAYDALLTIDLDRTGCKILELSPSKYGKIYELGFAYGGNWNNGTIPERHTCKTFGIILIGGWKKRCRLLLGGFGEIMVEVTTGKLINLR